MLEPMAVLGWLSTSAAIPDFQANPSPVRHAALREGRRAGTRMNRNLFHLPSL